MNAYLRMAMAALRCGLWTVGCGLFLYGCATVYNPATEKNELIFIDSAQEAQIGRGMAEQIIRKESKLLRDASKQLFANKIGQRIAAVSERRELVFHFVVLDDPDLNAFALPGGYVYIYSGLLNRLTEDELAAVLAHEVGHVAAKHSVKKMQSVLGYNLLMSLALAGFGPRHPEFAQEIANVSGTVYDLLLRGYGREDEILADKLAVKYLFKAGYDPDSMVRALEILMKESGPGGRMFEILSTHPKMQERIRRVREEITGLKNPLPEVDKTRRF